MATSNTSNEIFKLNPDSYAAFDALSLKNLIVRRLNSNTAFTDQNFEGSNISAIIDIIAYAYNVLLFYLNQTAAESTFTSSQLYENINKIVKLIGYNPIGYQTSILPFQATANFQLSPETYTIQRYAYFTVNGVYYSFNKDVTFTKSTSGTEFLADFSEQNLLYQGIYNEYPTYFANGSPYEILTLTLVDNNGDNIIIDHFNIDVYVKDNTVESPKWAKWESTQSLFLERSNSTKYEIRLNEDGRYEIKFGNNINGKQLNTGDEVAVFYLKSNGTSGQIGPGILNGNALFNFSTQKFDIIKGDTTPSNLNILSQGQLSYLSFSNVDPSTNFVEPENVSNIKLNAINTFKSQYRLITSEDFTNYLLKNYNNILASTKVVNNWDYLSQHVKYFFDLGIEKPNLESRILFNQVKFADACNFNNIYIYAVPKLEKVTSLTTRANYLNSAQKNLIINDLNQTKLATAEIIINDPIYVSVDLGVRVPGESLDPSISTNTYLEITRSVTSKRNPESVKKQVASIFSNYFSTTKDNLGLFISLTELSNQINSIEGITNIKTVRVEGTQRYEVPGISMLIYNPVYPNQDIEVISQDTLLPFFKFPFLNDSLNFINKINVITPSIQFLEREF
ncbi:MAG: hypothetical protein EBU90_06575 [Proteobacteria bacterium]|nr:hypothetical protein [Pseudomonadota bacterium]NBP15060.1 hypothetical protein [bacterium]